MMSITTLKFNKLSLVLVVGLHLAFVDAFSPREPNITLEEHKIIYEKIEFLKLSQKGCSQAVFVYDQQEPNCTISIWYTGAFHMWMLRNDVVRDFKKATVQELRTLPVQLCSCKKVHVSDFCPADAHNVTYNLLYSCKDFVDTSNEVPVGRVVEDLIKMVNDVKKLENISASIDYTTKINLSVGENSDHLTTLGSIKEEINAAGNEANVKGSAEVKSSVKESLKEADDNKNSTDKFKGRNALKQDMKLGSKDIDSKSAKKEESKTTEKHEVGETKDNRGNEENDSIKFSGAKQDNSTEYEVTTREMNFKTNGNATEVEKNKVLDKVDQISDILLDGEMSRKGEDSEVIDDDDETTGEIKAEIDDEDKEKDKVGATEGTIKIMEITTSEAPLDGDEDSESENSDEDNDDDLTSF